MFSWLWNATIGSSGDSDDDLSAASQEMAWTMGRVCQTPFIDKNNSPLASWTSNEAIIPGTLEYFQAFKDYLESQLRHPKLQLPPLFSDTLQSWQAARESLGRAQKVLQDLQQPNSHATKEEIQQAQTAVTQAQAVVGECGSTLSLIGESLLNCENNSDENDDDTISIPQFLSEHFDDSAWVSYCILQNPAHWAAWCCPTTTTTSSSDPQQVPPDPTRVAIATSFLLDLAAQRCVLAEGRGGPRKGNYGGYFEILQKLDSSSAVKEPVLQRLAQAVALEFAHGDYCYFDTQTAIDPVARYLQYEQAYLMGDLDPAFSIFEIWQLRLAVNSPHQDWELQWGRECLQTYRPDWALTADVQWRYCRLVRTDVGYTTPTWTSHPRTMDQILSGGGKCGPRAWFGRFMCQAFGVPIWGVRQPGHAAMSRWTEKGWMICLGASFAYSWWDGRCGTDFELETKVRAFLSSPAEHLRLVTRLEWLAQWQKESNQSILDGCTYNVAAPWYALSLVQRQLLAKAQMDNGAGIVRHFYPRSVRTTPKISRLQSTDQESKGVPIVCNNGGVCIPADSTISTSSNKIIIMPSFTGGRQVFLGQDALLDFALEPHWLPVVPSIFKMTVKMATAHRKDTTLLVTIASKERGSTDSAASQKQREGGDCIRLPLPYTKGLWGESESVEVTLCADNVRISLQRESRESYGIAVKEIRLEPC